MEDIKRHFEEVILNNFEAPVYTYLAKGGKQPSGISIFLQDEFGNKINPQVCFWFGPIKNDLKPDTSPMTKFQQELVEEYQKNLKEIITPILNAFTEITKIPIKSIQMDLFKYKDALSEEQGIMLGAPQLIL